MNGAGKGPKGESEGVRKGGTSGGWGGELGIEAEEKDDGLRQLRRRQRSPTMLMMSQVIGVLVLALAGLLCVEGGLKF